MRDVWINSSKIIFFLLKGRTIRKLMGGGAGEVQKKYSRKAKLDEKRPLTLKNIHATA